MVGTTSTSSPSFFKTKKRNEVRDAVEHGETRPYLKRKYYENEKPVRPARAIRRAELATGWPGGGADLHDPA